MKQYFGIIFLMCFFAFLGNGCKDDETVANSFLEVAVDTVNFTTAEGSWVVSVSSNVDWRAVVGEDWVDVSANGQELTIHVTENVGATLRMVCVCADLAGHANKLNKAINSKNSFFMILCVFWFTANVCG